MMAVGARKEREKVMKFVQALIDARLVWANSAAGRKVLGPGSPTVPGLQDLRHRVANELRMMVFDAGTMMAQIRQHKPFPTHALMLSQTISFASEP